MSFKDIKIIDQVSDTTSEIMSGIVSGVIDATSSVSQSAEAIVSSVSSGVGEAVYNMSAGMKRLVTSPPEEDETTLDTEILSSDQIIPTPDDHCGSENSFFSEINFLSSMPPGNSPEELISPSSDLGISENYFSEPEIFDLECEASIDRLEEAIYKAKEEILSCEESTQKRRRLVQRLIHLRLALEKAKESKEVSAEGVQVRQGHQLIPVSPRLKSPSTKQFCDKCCHMIWNVLHVAYHCSFCDYKCHGKCVKSNHPKCPSLKFEENPNFVTQICPEVGLGVQNFRCIQCRNLITGKNVWAEPRLCDYTGQYFCPACHWNAYTVIPARVIHNWEFQLYPVSQQAKHFLTFTKNKPLLALEELNPNLFMFVKELHIVQKMRKDLIMMKNYLRTCRGAQESRLLRKLEVRQHFVDNSDYYSLSDLIDLNDGKLIAFLKNVSEEFVSHIKEKCEVCRGKGFICELCDSEEVIFPFDDDIEVCKICQASFHKKCFSSISVCPKCIRQSSRRLKNQQEEMKSDI